MEYPLGVKFGKLGMKIKAYDMNGEPIWDAQGELVCEAPAPSMLYTSGTTRIMKGI